jgi:hypothetical protein
MDREHNIYHKNLQEQDLTGLAELCANVARNCRRFQTIGYAHSLRVECVRLRLDRSLNGGTTEVEKSLKKRLGEFLAGVPSWMLSGV